MFSKYKSLIGVFLFVFLMSAIGIYLYEQTNQPERRTISSAQLPNFKFYQKNGTTKELKEIKSKAILISFWASWCAPCLVELPEFQVLHDKFKNKGLQILPINIDDSAEEAYPFVERFWQKHKMDFTSYYDFAKRAADTLLVDRLPANFLVNENYEVIFESTGLQDWNSKQMHQLIEDSLN